MSANSSAIAQRRCPRCAQPMKLIRRTQRFGGLPDLYTFECQACGMSHTEECKPTIWHAADVYRKQAKACREMASQGPQQDRAFWLHLSDAWLKLARDADERARCTCSHGPALLSHTLECRRTRYVFYREGSHWAEPSLRVF